MKKVLLFILIAVLSISSFASCKDNSSNESDASDTTSKSVINVSCKKLLDIAINIDNNDGITVYTSEGTELGEYLDEFMISDLYGSLTNTPDFSIVDSYAVFMTDEQVVKECHIFKPKKKADAATIKEYLENRFTRVKEKFVGYLPEQVAYAEKGKVFEYGDFVIYITTISNNDNIIKAIKNKIDGK
ncbi:MAG: hypothetical protein A2Y17_10080 [Clostridiales bacterium GWF2_38_85]|nr:MAG: hypothetical protein A2Y17_10080 [Clostridiales bacterium GWF2_38_85]